MIVRLALRSLVSKPIRSAVLAGGFGLGVAVMAALLGIGSVILDQARAPALVGGGDVIVGSATGRLTTPKFVLADVLSQGVLGRRVKVASPNARANLYLIDDRGATPVAARGGTPSLERELGDPETRDVAAWADTPADLSWRSPRHEDVLRALDRFHGIPDVPARAGSWSEWLYFNGRSGDTRFYLTFLAGPHLAAGGRSLGVRLQLERAGKLTFYSDTSSVTDEDLASAPDLQVGPNSVRLVGSDYRIQLDLPAESRGPRARGDLVVRAMTGRAIPPFTMRGAGGWVSGYVVPVPSGELTGTMAVGTEQIEFRNATAYHDHNWGFWEGVRWQWGQVQGEGLSFVYGRVYPPADAADATRVPGFLVALGPDGLVGYATEVTIEETNATPTSPPTRIVVTGHSETLALTLDIAVDHVATTPMRGRAPGGMNFLQLRGSYRLSGRAGHRQVDFTAPGSAETFR